MPLPAAGPSRLGGRRGRREREARWEGREREAALGSSPPPSLGSSPLPTLGSSPLLPGTLGLITGATARADAGGTLAPGGGTHDPEAWGWGGGRAAAAVPPSPALTSPSCFSSNQPVSLRGGGGGSALGRRVRARAARDLFREGTVGRVSISRALALFYVISSTAFDAFARTLSLSALVRLCFIACSTSSRSFFNFFDAFARTP